MAADARDVVTAYFDALARRDVDTAATCWAPDGVDTIVGQTVAHGPEGVRAFFAELFAAVLDTEQARASVRTVAGLAPSAAWPGHAEPLRGDIAAQLEQAAATT